MSVLGRAGEKGWRGFETRVSIMEMSQCSIVIEEDQHFGQSTCFGMTLRDLSRASFRSVVAVSRPSAASCIGLALLPIPSGTHLHIFACFESVVNQYFMRYASISTWKPCMRHPRFTFHFPPSTFHLPPPTNTEFVCLMAMEHYTESGEGSRDLIY